MQDSCKKTINNKNKEIETSLFIFLKLKKNNILKPEGKIIKRYERQVKQGV